MKDTETTLKAGICERIKSPERHSTLNEDTLACCFLHKDLRLCQLKYNVPGCRWRLLQALLVKDNSVNAWNLEDKLFYFDSI